MARAPSAKVSQAEQMYLAGQKLIDIARQLDVPEGTVRRWKCTYKWDSERSDKKASVRKTKRQKKKKEEAAAELVDQESDLTDKQRLFCLYYVRTFNATKAYQKAYGCRYEVARSIAYRQLHKEAILQEIQRLKKERINRELFTEEDIFQKYVDIAFADVTDFVDFDVDTIDLKRSTEVDGTLLTEVRQGKDGVSIKLADRMRALDWLADHMDLATDEQRAKIEQIKAQTDKLTGNNQEIEDLSEIEGEIYGE